MPVLGLGKQQLRKLTDTCDQWAPGEHPPAACAGSGCGWGGVPTGDGDPWATPAAPDINPGTRRTVRHAWVFRFSRPGVRAGPAAPGPGQAQTPGQCGVGSSGGGSVASRLQAQGSGKQPGGRNRSTRLILFKPQTSVRGTVLHWEKRRDRGATGRPGGRLTRLTLVFSQAWRLEVQGHGAGVAASGGSSVRGWQTAPTCGGGRPCALSQGHSPGGRGPGSMTPLNLSRLLTAPPPDTAPVTWGLGLPRGNFKGTRCRPQQRNRVPVWPVPPEASVLP